MKQRVVTVDSIQNWKPTHERTTHGYKVYASRVIQQGEALTAAGDVAGGNAKLAKAKAYCEARKIPFPPFSKEPISTVAGDSPTALNEAGRDVGRGPAVPVAVDSSSMAPSLKLPPLPVPKPKVPEPAPFIPASTWSAQKAETIIGDPDAKEPKDGPRSPEATIAPAQLMEARNGGENGPPVIKEGSIVTAKVVLDGKGNARIVRKAKIWAVCPNPKLMSIRLMDGAQELASLWKNRTDYRLNDVLEVALERGGDANPIFEEIRRPV